jgi:hypothetical protein
MGDMDDGDRTGTPDALVLDCAPRWEDHLQVLRRLRTETDRLIGDDPGPFGPLLVQLLRSLDSLAALTSEAAAQCRLLSQHLPGAELQVRSGTGH